MSAVGKILYRVLRDEHAASTTAESLQSTALDAVAARPERPRVLSADAGRRRAAAADGRRCSASASSKSRKAASSSPAAAEERFYNGMGVAHGGFAATLLDTALGCAINTTSPPGKRFTTLELKVNYTRPLRREVGEVRCEATSFTSAAAPPPPKAASSIATASSTRTARRRASSSSRHGARGDQLPEPLTPFDRECPHAKSSRLCLISSTTRSRIASRSSPSTTRRSTR